MKSTSRTTRSGLAPHARVVPVAALIVGPGTLIVTTVLQWTLHPSGAHPGAIDVAGQFPGMWLTIGLLSVFGPVAWLAGLPAAIALAPARGRVLTMTGGLVTGAGMAAGVGHLALYFGLYASAAASGLGRGALRRLDEAADGETIGNVLLIVFLIGFAVGPVLLTIGLRIARVVGVWVPLAAIVTAAAGFFGGTIAGVVQLITLVLLWAPIALAVAGREHRELGEVRTRFSGPDRTGAPV
jgi:hypothetical protein